MKNNIYELKTKFRLKAFLPLIPACGLAIFLFGIAFNFINNGFNYDIGWVKYLFLFYFWLVLIWVIFGEIRHKFIVVKLFSYYILISRFGGLLPSKKVTYHQIDYFKNSVLRSKGCEYEYLYLYKSGKRIAKISEFYHANYSDAKDFIRSKIKDEGFERFSYLDELKDIFR